MGTQTTNDIRKLILEHYDAHLHDNEEALIVAKLWVVMREAKTKKISWDRLDKLYELANRAMDESGY